MDELHQRLGESILSKYRTGKLTRSVLKEEITAASKEADQHRDAETIRYILRRLKFMAVIKDDARLIKEYHAFLRQWSWHDSGSGI